MDKAAPNITVTQTSQVPQKQTPQIIKQQLKEKVELPPGPKNPVALLVLLVILLFGTTGYLAYQNIQLRKQIGQVQPTLSPSPAPITPAETNKYTSNRGVSFTYFDGWEVFSQTLEPGENLKELDKYDVVADKNSLEVVDIKKGDWLIRLVIGDALNSLGGQGPIQTLDEFKKIPLLGRNALRTKVEEGHLPFIGGGRPEPYPFPILFQRKPGETDNVYTTPDSEESYVTLFTTNDPSNSINLSITIYSVRLTKSNIENLNIDTKDLQEIDQILSTFEFTN